MPVRRALFLALGCAAVFALLWWGTHRHPAARPAGQDRSRADDASADARAHRGDPASQRAARLPSQALVTVRGTVFDAQTSRVVGGGEVVFRGTGGKATTIADGRGEYVIDVRPGVYRASVHGTGFTSVGLRRPERIPGPPTEQDLASARDEAATVVVIQADQEGVDLRVERVGTVRGRVVNRKGAPIARAIVRAEGDRQPVSGGDIVETGADGGFALELPAGGYEIDASHPDYAGVTGSTRIEIDPDRPSDSLELTLAVGCVIRGRAFGASGLATGDGSIDYRTASMPDFEPSAPVARDGTFRFATLEEGEVSIRAWPWQSPPSAPQTFRCTEGARYEAILRVDDAASDLDGTIRTADGRAAGGAYLDIFALTPGGMNQQERADEEGNWAVFALPPGDYMVTAVVDGEGAVRQRMTVPAHDVALMLGGTGSIAGSAAGFEDGTFTLSMSGCGSRESVLDARLVLVKDGRFRVDGVPACALSLHAKSGPRESRANVDVKAGAEARASLDLSAPPGDDSPPALADLGGNAAPAPIDDPAPERDDRERSNTAAPNGAGAVPDDDGDDDGDARRADEMPPPPQLPFAPAPAQADDAVVE